MSIYCGNNKLDPKLISGNSILGNRYQCMKKGFGVGYYIKEPNVNMLSPYEPLYNKKMYCGLKQPLPENYDIYGTPPECFKKGIGSGMKQKALKFFTERPRPLPERPLPERPLPERPLPSLPDKGILKRSRKRSQKRSRKRSQKRSRKRSRKRSQKRRRKRSQKRIRKRIQKRRRKRSQKKT